MRHLVMLCCALLCIAALCGCGARAHFPQEPSLDFSLDSLDGQVVTLEELRGKWVLVNFWATWCGPCVAEMPELQRLADDESDSLIVLGINMREDEHIVRGFVDDLEVRYPILLNPHDGTLLAYNVLGLPATWLLVPNGTVAFSTFGEVDTEEIRALLNESAKDLPMAATQ